MHQHMHALFFTIKMQYKVDMDWERNVLETFIIQISSMEIVSIFSTEFFLQLNFYKLFLWFSDLKSQMEFC